MLAKLNQENKRHLKIIVQPEGVEDSDLITIKGNVISSKIKGNYVHLVIKTKKDLNEYDF